MKYEMLIFNWSLVVCLVALVGSCSAEFCRQIGSVCKLLERASDKLLCILLGMFEHKKHISSYGNGRQTCQTREIIKCWALRSFHVATHKLYASLPLICIHIWKLHILLKANFCCHKPSTWLRSVKELNFPTIAHETAISSLRRMELREGERWSDLHDFHRYRQKADDAMQCDKKLSVFTPQRVKERDLVENFESEP